jgi:hypothetical protein
MPGGMMIPGRNMPTTAAMIGGLASYATSLGQVTHSNLLVTSLQLSTPSPGTLISDSVSICLYAHLFDFAGTFFTEKMQYKVLLFYTTASWFGHI